MIGIPAIALGPGRRLSGVSANEDRDLTREGSTIQYSRTPKARYSWRLLVINPGPCSGRDDFGDQRGLSPTPVVQGVPTKTIAQVGMATGPHRRDARYGLAAASEAVDRARVLPVITADGHVEIARRSAVRSAGTSVTSSTPRASS